MIFMSINPRFNAHINGLLDEYMVEEPRTERIVVLDLIDMDEDTATELFGQEASDRLAREIKIDVTQVYMNDTQSHELVGSVEFDDASAKFFDDVVHRDFRFI